MDNPETQQPLTLLRRDEVTRRLGVSTGGLYKLMAEGALPRPVRLAPGGRYVAWPEHEIQRYIQQRISERNAAIDAAIARTARGQRA